VLSAGIYTVAPTPFDSDGAVDVASVGKMASALVELGIEGLLVLGVMGEADKLLDDERDAVLRRFVEAVDGAASVIAGTSHASSRGASELTRRAQEAGATAVMVSPPGLAKPNPEAVFDFFGTVSKDCSIDIVLQDHPASSGVFLPVELIARICDEIEGVTALKLEDPPTPPKIASVLQSAGESVSVYGGLGGVKLIEELDSGAVGTMTGFAFPEVLDEIWRLHQTGDRQGARNVFFRYLPLILFEAQPLLSLPVRKRLYQKRGLIATDHVRAPAATLDRGTLEELDILLDGLDLG
jgi:4-hydroxy-tetrahydrodipicolinate synthase